MLKRYLSVLLTICMFFTMVQPTMVFAADEGTLVVGEGSVAEGDADTIVPITINKTGSLGAITLGFQVTFPEELILTEKPVVGSLFADAGLHLDTFTSPYAISLGSDTTAADITAEGIVVTLNFKVKEGAAAKKYDITIVNQDNTNADLDTVEFGVTSGGITVTSASGGGGGSSSGGGGSATPIFSVTFNGNGGTPETTAVPVTSGAKVTAPATNPTREGYDFTGWFQEAAATTAFDFDAPITAPTTAYAGWKEKEAATVDVTFDGNGGTPATTTVSVTSGAKVTAPATNPTREGYDFTGWFQEAAATTAFDFDAPITAATTAYAGWKEKEATTFDVTFDGNGGTPATATVSVTSGAKVTAPATNPTREGYDFTGWFQEAAATTAFDFDALITAATTAYAGWKAKTFDVTFDGNGGTPATTTLSVTSGEKVTAPANPTREGYDFTGWFQEAAATTAFDFDAPITAATTAYAGWKAKTFDVTFDGNGGTPATTTVSVTSGEKVTAPANPTRENYDFTGWFSDKNGKNAFDLTAPITAAVTVYAGWKEAEKDNHTDAPAAQGGLVIGNATVAEGDTTTIVPIAIDKKGSTGAITLSFQVTFPDELILTAKPVVGGLFADAGLHQDVFTSPYAISLGSDTTTADITAEGTVVTLNFKVKEGAAPGSYPITIINQDNTNFELDPVDFPVTAGSITVTSGGGGGAATYVVTFDGNGGTPASTPVNVKSGEKVTAPANPTRDGYDFTGWFTDKDGKNAFDLNAPITAAVTAYAGWTAKETPSATVNVTFDGNGGAPATTTVPVKSGEKVTAPVNPTRGGYDFTGWFSDKDGKNAFDLNAPITAAVTVYAGWKAKAVQTYVVTFDGNGGTPASTPVNVKSGDKVTAPATNPTRVGYTFDGWFSDRDGKNAFNFDTSITAAVTAYAGWKAVETVQVSFNTNGGSTIPSTTVNKGSAVNKPTDPTRDGYTFDGWFSDTALKNAVTFPLTVNEDTILYAAWKETPVNPPVNPPADDNTAGGGCYIATSVYGSYDTPEVWTLRRFRDDVLGQTWYGRLFIKAYYATSPTLVRLFGDAEWFQNFWRDRLDTLVQSLQDDGFESTPYQDKDW